MESPGGGQEDTYSPRGLPTESQLRSESQMTYDENLHAAMPNEEAMAHQLPGSAPGESAAGNEMALRLKEMKQRLRRQMDEADYEDWPNTENSPADLRAVEGDESQIVAAEHHEDDEPRPDRLFKNLAANANQPEQISYIDDDPSQVSASAYGIDTQRRFEEQVEHLPERSRSPVARQAPPEKPKFFEEEKKDEPLTTEFGEGTFKKLAQRKAKATTGSFQNVPGLAGMKDMKQSKLFQKFMQQQQNPSTGIPRPEQRPKSPLDSGQPVPMTQVKKGSFQNYKSKQQKLEQELLQKKGKQKS